MVFFEGLGFWLLGNALRKYIREESLSASLFLSVYQGESLADYGSTVIMIMLVISTLRRVVINSRSSCETLAQQNIGGKVF